MPRAKESVVPRTIKIPLSQAASLEFLASQAGIPRHQILREAINEYLLKRNLVNVKKSSQTILANEN